MPGHGSSELRKARYDGPQTCLVTVACADRVLGRSAEARTLVAEALLWLRSQNRIVLHAFVVMPDHYHALMSIRDSESLSQVMHGLNGFTAKRINEGRNWTGAVWQGGYHEDGMHDRAPAAEALQYVCDNPVRAGLADKPEDYPWSSAHEAFRPYADGL